MKTHLTQKDNEIYSHEFCGDPSEKKVRKRVTVCQDESDPIPVAFGVVSTPQITVVEATNNGDKYSHTFSTGARRFTLMHSVEKCAVISYNWNETDFDNDIFATIDDGAEYGLRDVNLDGRTIYFKTDQDSIKVEIEEWS